MRLVWIANNIDKDIIEAVDSGIIPEQPIEDSDTMRTKCSKSVVPNALYYISKGEEVEFFLGTMKQKEPSLVAHCWIEHNGKVLQTNVSNPNVELFSNFSVKLPPDIEKAKAEIKALVKRAQETMIEK